MNSSNEISERRDGKRVERPPAGADGSMYGQENRGNVYGEPLPPHLSSLGRRRRKRKGRKGGPNKVSLFVSLGLILVLVGYFSLLGWSFVKRSNAKKAKQAAAAAAGTSGVGPAPGQPAEPAPVPQDEKEIMADLAAIRGETRITRDVLLKIKLVQQQEGTEAAIAQLRERLKKTPHFQPLRLDLAELYYDDKQYTEARRELVRALAAEANDSKARMLLARTLMKEENMYAAIHMTDWILADDKYEIDALNLKSQCYMALGDMRNAIFSLQRILDLDSRNQKALSNLGLAYARTKDYRKAAKIFTSVLGADDSNSVAYYNLAICHAQMKDPEAAVELLNKASAKFGMNFVSTWIQAPEFDPIRSNGAFVLFRRKMQEEAGSIRDNVGGSDLPGPSAP